MLTVLAKIEDFFTSANVTSKAGIVLILAFGLVKIVEIHDSYASVPYIRSLPIIGNWTFFTKRGDFVANGLKRFGKVFRFRVINRTVTIVAGEEARKVFFEHNMPFGYDVFLPPSPKPSAVMSAEEVEKENFPILKAFVNLLRKPRLEKVLPQLFSDLDHDISRLGDQGKMDPFVDIYNLVLQLTVRVLSARELADDPQKVARISVLYRDMEYGANARSIFLPWLPNKPRDRRDAATRELFGMLYGIIETRSKSGRSEDDALQVLLDDGYTAVGIVKFIIGALFAGVTNTGLQAAWILMHLAFDPEWKAKVTAEIESFVSKHGTTGGSYAARLAEIPLTAWEEEMPILEACHSEMIRILMNGLAMRQNVSGEMKIDGVPIKKGDYIGYSLSDVHMNPDIYPNPKKFDPTRFLGESRKAPLSFVGWGAGRHPCLGMRFAKLEVKSIVSLFLCDYDYTMVDSRGKMFKKLPDADLNDLARALPLEPVYFEYRKKNPRA